MTTRKFKVGDVVQWTTNGHIYLLVQQSKGGRLTPINLENSEIFMDYLMDKAEESEYVIVLGNMKDMLAKASKLYGEKGKS